MKMLDIYSKKDLDMLIFDGKMLSEIMDDFFVQFPESYRENSDKNIETMEIDL